MTPDVACTYPAGSFGELDANVNGLLATQEHNTVPFSLEADTAPEFYVTVIPGRTRPRCATSNTASRHHRGEPVHRHHPEDRQLHRRPGRGSHPAHGERRPARTPTFAMFAKPDYYLYDGSATCSGSCVSRRPLRRDHGDYAAEINTIPRPGRPGAPSRARRPTASQGPSSAGRGQRQITVSQQHFPGPWVDETDIRPTLMYLTGLRDDYEHDGRVITQVLADPNRALSDPAVTTLGECYKQLNSSVGEFGAATLQASTNAVDSTSAGTRPTSTPTRP